MLLNLSENEWSYAVLIFTEHEVLPSTAEFVFTDSSVVVNVNLVKSYTRDCFIMLHTGVKNEELVECYGAVAGKTSENIK